MRQLATQTIPPEIFVWNNRGPYFWPKPDWAIRSSKNTITWARWLMGSMAATEFLAVMDDDLILKDGRVLEDAIAYLRGTPLCTLIGPTGVNFSDPTLCYKNSPRVNTSKSIDQSADMILGRLVILRTAALRHVHLMPGNDRRLLLSDDIVISAQLANGEQQFHRVPRLFADRIGELPAPHPSCGSADHFILRDEMRRLYFRPNEAGTGFRKVESGR